MFPSRTKMYVCKTLALRAARLCYQLSSSSVAHAIRLPIDVDQMELHLVQPLMSNLPSIQQVTERVMKWKCRVQLSIEIRLSTRTLLFLVKMVMSGKLRSWWSTRELHVNYHKLLSKINMSLPVLAGSWHKDRTASTLQVHLTFAALLDYLHEDFRRFAVWYYWLGVKHNT